MDYTVLIPLFGVPAALVLLGAFCFLVIQAAGAVSVYYSKHKSNSLASLAYAYVLAAEQRVAKFVDVNGDGNLDQDKYDYVFNLLKSNVGKWVSDADIEAAIEKAVSTAKRVGDIVTSAGTNQPINASVAVVNTKSTVVETT